MSKHHHSAVAREIQDLVKAVQGTPQDDWRTDHGIEKLANGKVLDTVSRRTYNSILEWATVIVEDDEFAFDGGMENKKARYDDEY